jgi:hypothetical protein
MQLKTKMFMPLVVILLTGTMTTAFAQLTCSVSSTPVSRATVTGLTEPAGDLTFTCSEGLNATTDATVTIEFGGAPITNDVDYPTGGGISIINTTGEFVGTVTISDVNYETGQIVIDVAATTPDATDTSSFTLTNVLVSLLPITGNNLRASVSVSPGDNISVVANQDEATVISSIREGLADIELEEGPARYLATGTAVTGDTANFIITVEEGYIDSFRARDQVIDGATNPVLVQFQFSGIPEDGSLTCDGLLDGVSAAVELSDDLEDFVKDPAGAPTGDADDFTFEDGTIYAGFADSAPDLSSTETLELSCSAFNVGDAVLPLSGSITVRVGLAPVGEELDDDVPFEDPFDGGEVPRFDEVLTDAITVLNFTPATTTMIVPLAMATPVTPAPFGSYDTGIAIANTTLDPFENDEEGGGALEQAGAITFHFFPNSGDPFIVTPAQLAGACGLDASGVLAAGRTFICNTSEILREGGQTTAFTGYLFIIADFTHAHGTAFIYGGTPQERFTSATDILNIEPPAVQPRITNPESTWR